MKLWTLALGLVLAVGTVTTASAQFPSASEEHKILKHEDGNWDCEITMFMGPAGPYNPPQKSKGSEKNTMLGDFWLVSEFKGSFEGMPFQGRGQIGYDPGKKKYVGSWIDSFSPNATHMIGTYDAEKKMMTYETTGIGMDGNPTKGKQTVVYGDNKRTMTMYAAAPGTDQMIKVMEISYTKAK